MAEDFRVTLSLRKEPGAQPVFCKMEPDGRFAQAKTVKLAVEATYRIDVSFKPPRSLDALRVLGEPADAQERSRDRTACAYSSYWNTNALSVSRRGERTQLVIAMQVAGSGELSTVLQVKLYKHGTSAVDAGSRLHCIELDCNSSTGALAGTQ